MSLRLSYRNLGEERMYVPLIGVSGTSNPYLQINTIVDRVAERHRARSYFVSVPAFRELSSPFSEIEEQRMATLEQYWSRLDAVVFGLGGPPHNDGLFVDKSANDTRRSLWPPLCLAISFPISSARTAPLTISTAFTDRLRSTYGVCAACERPFALPAESIRSRGFRSRRGWVISIRL
jgi:hypothetical protein